MAGAESAEPLPVMPGQQYTKFVVAAAAVLFVFMLWKSGSRRGIRRPPSPPRLPLIGSIVTVLTSGKLPHLALHNLAQKYGPIMSLKMGSRNLMIISSVELAKEVFGSALDPITSFRLPSVQGDELFYDGIDIIYAQKGDRLRLLRRLCKEELLSPSHIQRFKHVRMEEGYGLIERLLQSTADGTLVALHQALLESAFNTMTRTMFGKAYYGQKTVTTAESNESKEFQGLFHDHSKIWLFATADFLPWLRRFDVDGVAGKLRRLSLQFDIFFNKVINESRSKGDRLDSSTETKTFLDILLELQRKNEDKKLSDNEIKGLILDLLFGGISTSSSTVVWAVSELLTHPEMMKKAVEEVDSKIGRDRLVQESDLDNLPYVRAVLRETLRLHPVLPVLTRYATSPIKLAGYDVPQGTGVWVNVFTIQRDPKVWPNPLEFNPERFVIKEYDLKATKCDFFPFGAGRRLCVGLPLGIIQVELNLAQLLQTCIIELPEGVKPEDVDMEERISATTDMKSPPLVHIRPRLVPKVYKEAGMTLKV